MDNLTQKPNRKETIQMLLGRLNQLQNGSFPIGGTMEDIINKEYTNVTDEVKKNSVIKMLDNLDARLTSFRQDFDSFPLSKSFTAFQGKLDALRTEITDAVTTSSSVSESKLNDLFVQMQTLLSEQKTEAIQSTEAVSQSIIPLSHDVAALEGEIVLLKKKVTSLNPEKKLAVIEEKTNSLFKELQSQIPADKTKEFNKQIAATNKLITELRIDLLNRLAERGGGGISRRIQINGTTISTRYNDINFKGNGVTYSAVDNNTTKQVDLTLIASGGGGGGTGSIFSETPSGLINSSNVTYTTLNSISTVLNFSINGQELLPDTATQTNDFSFSGTTITMHTALDSSLSGLPFVFVYTSGSIQQGSELTATGTIDSSNMAFTFTQKPTYVVMDGVYYKEGGGWSWNAGTLTVTMSKAPDFAIWGIA